MRPNAGRTCPGLSRSRTFNRGKAGRHLLADNKHGEQQEYSSKAHGCYERPCASSWVLTTQRNGMKGNNMAKATTKPAAPAIRTEGLHLVKLENYSIWDDVMLIPAELLSQFAMLMSKVVVAKKADTGNGTCALIPRGGTTFSTRSFSPDSNMLVSDAETAARFEAFHIATTNLMGSDKPPYGQLAVTMEEFLAQDTTITE